ncbi:amino acid permease [Desulfobacula phenolica]|uniref:Transporter, cation-chloride cotransporter (CCC) family (TC 2.A.30) n=1 Tax=Desulfobacula phenolica TaxID=90732 RepID=A0A1H2EDE7_9BACT|nr:amino acid permease [Desulfobacula phenolica]SDT93167.1 transporter, cation-chloride cotransporter (CCC) family (TC 2.A.30) [Desulfobacula phenolica]
MSVSISPKKNGSLGTFAGVFTPSILTILGIILFRRMGYVLGEAGLAKTLIIMCLANSISVLTSFSLAAIATNLKVKGGGDYYLISRTLGLEFGGAIGIVLFLAQSVSIAFYCIGFGEAISGMGIFADIAFLPQMIAATALLLLFVLAWTGADWATKFQYAVMAILVLALISFFIGGFQKWDTNLLWASRINETDNTGFWILFAIFFPAVTGFTQGVSMSGDLKDPGKSLPLGTFLAVALSVLIYLAVAVVYSASSPLATLASNYNIMKDTAQWGIFIDAGVISATLSSAMASFLGAPRILQSLARDKIFAFLNPFALGAGAFDNPRRGVLLSLCIALGTIAMGQLDLIAKVVSMFFLISYGLLNYATYFEAATQSPSFRPRFRWYHRNLSLAGFLICLGVMLAIDWKTGVAAVAILFAIYQYLKRTSGPSRWADSQRSYHLQQIRKNLLATQEDIEHPREWRPFILVLSGSSDHRLPLLWFASLVEGGSGLTTAVNMVVRQGIISVKAKDELTLQLQQDLLNFDSRAFGLFVSAPDVETGLDILIQSYGIGPVKANTILINWNEKSEKSEKNFRNMYFPDYKQQVQKALRDGCNVVFFDGRQIKELLEYPDQEDEIRIDVWWRGDDTSNLLLLLAYLVTRNEKWESASIRLLAVNYSSDSPENQDALSKRLDEIRINALPVIVTGVTSTIIKEKSKDAHLVFIPFIMKQKQPVCFTGDLFETILPDIKVAAMAMAAKTMQLDAEPEEGKVKELADLYDQLVHAEKRAQVAEKRALDLARAAAGIMESIDLTSHDNTEEIVKKINESIKIRKKAASAGEKAFREKAKLEQALKNATEQGVKTDRLPSGENNDS